MTPAHLSETRHSAEGAPRANFVDFVAKSRVVLRSGDKPKGKMLLGVNTKNGLLWTGKSQMVQEAPAIRPRKTVRKPSSTPTQREQVVTGTIDAKVSDELLAPSNLEFLQGNIMFDEEGVISDEGGSLTEFLSGEVTFDDDLEVPKSEVPVTYVLMGQDKISKDVLYEAQEINVRNPAISQRTDIRSVDELSYATSSRAFSPNSSAVGKASDGPPNETIDRVAVNLMELAEANFTKVAEKIVNDTARLMQTYADVWADHLRRCKGEEDGHPNITASKQAWIVAHDASSSRVSELVNDVRVKEALKKGDIAQVGAIIQEETLRVYGEKVGIDTKKLRNMSSELFSVSNPIEAMVMMQGALTHVGCACHPGDISAMNPFLFGATSSKSKEHSHEHKTIYCGCGWKGKHCESEACPRCRKKDWISESKYQKKLQDLSKKNQEEGTRTNSEDPLSRLFKFIFSKKR